MSTEQDMLDALIQHQVYTHRASTKVVNELNKGFTSATNTFANRLRELLDELTDSEREALTAGKYTTDTLKELREAFSEYYDYTVTAMPEAFAASAATLAAYEVGYMASLYGDTAELTNPQGFLKDALNKPVVDGRLAKNIWGDIGRKVQEKALYATVEGIQQGLTTAQIVAQIRGTRTKVGDKYIYVGGIIEDAVGNANKKGYIDGAVRTIRNHISQLAYEETFNALGFTHVKDVCTLDGRTTYICKNRDGVIQPIDNIKMRPPYHYRCRTVQIGCDADGKIDGKRPFVASNKPVAKIPKNARDGVIGQVDANTTYPTWFKRQSAEFQREALGKTKYEPYKKGGYTLDKFVDPLGKEYTIAQLRALDQKTFKELGL